MGGEEGNHQENILIQNNPSSHRQHYKIPYT